MNYTSLVSQIQAFLEDDSTELQASIDDIITQAENMIFQRLPSLPCFRNVTTGTLIVDTFDYAIANARMIRQVAVTDGDSKQFYCQQHYMKLLLSLKRQKRYNYTKLNLMKQ
jgi:uncharacterized Rossmann fold enzyme